MYAMHAERGRRIRVRYGRGGFAGLRRAQLGAAKPGCACKRNPLRFLWLALAPQAVFPNNNINGSGCVQIADLTLAHV